MMQPYRAKLPLTQRVSRAFRTLWSGYGGGFRGGGLRGMFSRWVGTLPGSNYNLAREVGDPAQNSAVAICLNWIADQFAEPELQALRRKRDRTEESLVGHPLLSLVDNPNPFYDGDSLWAATVFSYCVDGNAYWIKLRGMGGQGAPVQLWYVPHWQIEPRWSPDGSDFISHYEYFVDGKAYPLPLRDVIHFADKINPQTRKGVSRLYPALRSVAADNEADTFCWAILKNMGIPGVLLVPESDALEITTETREDLEAMWADGFTGDNRGKPLIPNGKLKPYPLSMSPEQLTLDKIRQVPEDRICASLRLNPMVVGLTSGAAHKTYANFAEARAAAYEDCIIPLQKRLARTLERQLLPDLDDPSRVRLAWDYSEVNCLREDEDARHARARDNYQKGIMTRNEARAMVGLPPVEELAPEEEDDDLGE